MQEDYLEQALEGSPNPGESSHGMGGESDVIVVCREKKTALIFAPMGANHFIEACFRQAVLLEPLRLCPLLAPVVACFVDATKIHAEKNDLKCVS